MGEPEPCNQVLISYTDATLCSTVQNGAYSVKVLLYRHLIVNVSPYAVDS